MNLLLQDLTNLLKQTNFKDFELIQQSYDEKHFGNAEMIFRVGKLLVRFVRDRGQSFIDIASTALPERFYQFDTVEIAMGWKPIEEVIGKSEPEDLKNVLCRLSQKFDELEAAMSGEQVNHIRCLLEKADKDRGAAFVARLKRIHPS